MSKTLLVVLAYAKASPMLAHLWPWYERAGCDIIGVGREDTVTHWPRETGIMDNGKSFLGEMRIGKDSYVNGDNLPRRLVDVWSVLTELSNFYDDFCVTEHDAAFLKPLPEHPGDGLITTLAGGESPGFFAPRFFHPFWWTDRGTTDMMADFGRRMLACGLNENGFPDRWIGLMQHLYGIHTTAAMSYSKNTLDRPEYITEARRAIDAGAIYVHGIKTPEQLRQVVGKG